MLSCYRQLDFRLCYEHSHANEEPLNESFQQVPNMIYQEIFEKVQV